MRGPGLVLLTAAMWAPVACDAPVESLEFEVVQTLLHDSTAYHPGAALPRRGADREHGTVRAIHPQAGGPSNGAGVGSGRGAGGVLLPKVSPWWRIG